MANVFEKPKVDLSDKSLVAVFTAHNEADRIPYFLTYYRRHGVKHFFAIDNNSTDGTRDLLMAQPDVTYFFTSASYASSKAGRLWTSELANHYAVGKWCLTLDLDEQLVFPGSDYALISELCSYLDDHGYEGLFTVFLDMYSGGALSEAIYTPGRPFLEVCNYFDIDSYTLRQPQFFPHVQVFGGPRQRIFWQQGKSGRGPSMRKLPLIKWKQGFKYQFSTHSSTPVRLADITGALLHFKFFSSFKSLAERESARGDRVQKEDYARYARLSQEQDLVFRHPGSLRYETTDTLVEQGVMVGSKRFAGYIRPRVERRLGRPVARKCEEALRTAMTTAVNASALSLRHLPTLWPLLGSPVNAGVVCARGNTILLWYRDFQPSTEPVAIQARVAGEVVATAAPGIDLWDRAVFEPGLREDLFRIDIPSSVFARHTSVHVELCTARDPQPFATVRLFAGASAAASSGIDGTCHDSTDGKLRGWAVDENRPDGSTGIEVHIDGRYWRRTSANQYRKSLQDRGLGDGQYGFVLDLPEWLTAGGRHVVELYVEGTNAPLRRSPLLVEGLTVSSVESSHERLVLDGPGAASRSDLSGDGAQPMYFGATLPSPQSGGTVVDIKDGHAWGWIGTDKAADVVALSGSRVVARTSGGVPVRSHPNGEVVSAAGFRLPVLPRFARLRMARRPRVLKIVAGDHVLAPRLDVYHPSMKLRDTPFRGHLEAVSGLTLSGWAWRPDAALERIAVSVYIDGRYVTQVLADSFRADLLEAGIGDGYHAFALKLPGSLVDGLPHKIEVQIVMTGLRLSGSPLSFQRAAPSAPSATVVRGAESNKAQPQSVTP